MKAIVPAHGTPALVDWAEPIPNPEQVRIRTYAMALNNGDLAASGDGIAGFEFSGVVDAVGDDTQKGLIGQRVMGIAEEAFADFVVADHRHVVRIPEELGFAEAAALPTGLGTEYGALRRAGLQAGDTVLITAATSGIALIGIPVARALGARIILGTTRTADRADVVRRAGADHVIVLEEGVNLADQVREILGGTGADVVLDHVGGAGLRDAIDAAREGGTVISVGRLAGPTAEIDLFRLARQQVALQSVSYGLTPPEVIGNLLANTQVDLMNDVAAGRVRPIIDSQYSFADAAAAYTRLGSGQAQGKVVLTVA